MGTEKKIASQLTAKLVFAGDICWNTGHEKAKENFSSQCGETQQKNGIY